MKRLSLYTLLFLLGSTAFAQQAVRIPKVGFSIYITHPPDDPNLDQIIDNLSSGDALRKNHKSYAAGIMLKYRLKGLNLIRLRLNYASLAQEGLNDFRSSIINDTQVSSEATTNFEQQQLSIIPGITWASNISLLRIHYGFELPLTFFREGEFTQNILMNRREEDQLNDIRITGVSQTSTEASIPTGYSVGLGSLVGFTYQFSSHFEIGGEILFQVNYQDRTGTVIANRDNNQIITVQFGNSAPDINEFSEIRVDRWETGQRGVEVSRPSALFFLNYWF
ncbi:MAG: hypothetical protein AAGG75_20185 [Bacteroidota bacterium]